MHIIEELRMIERIHSFWGIKPEHIVNDQFTGYEDKYNELDTFLKNDKQKNVMTWCKKETGVEE